MLSSIHPLGERSRNNRWWLTITAFTIGSTATGGAVGATLGWIGTPLPDATWVFALAAVAAGALDLAAVKAPGPERQVNERWIGTFRGWVYGLGFGAQLGAGVVTFVVTWGVYSVFVAEVLSGSALGGAVIGATFGLGRSLAPLASVFVDRPSRLTSFHMALARLARPVHVSSAVAVVAVGLAGWLVT